MKILKAKSRLTRPSRDYVHLAKMALFVLGALFLALIGGLFTAVFPAVFVLKVEVLAVAGVILVFALLAPRDLAPPDRVIRLLLNTLLFLMGAYPDYISYKAGPLPGINPERLVYWTLIAVWLFYITASRQFRVTLFERLKPFKVFFAVISLFTVWEIATGFASKEWFFSAYYALKSLVPGYLIFMIAISAYRNLEDLEKAMVVVVVAALVASSLGFAEAVHGRNLFTRFFPSDPEQLQTLQWILIEKSREGALRVSSTFSHPLALAEYLSMCLPLAAYLVLNGSRPLYRLLGVVAFPLTIGAIYLTHTRSALISVGAVTLTFLFIGSVRAMRQRKNFGYSLLGAYMLIGVVLSGMAAVGLGQQLAEGRNADEQGSTKARVIMYQRGVDLIEKQPVLGYGPGLAALTIGFLPGQTHLTIDSYFLSLAIESGFVGLLLYLGVLFYPIIRGLILSMADSGRQSMMSLSVTVALLAFAVERTILSLTNNMDFSWVLTGMLLTVILLQPNSIGSIAERGGSREK